MAGPKRFTVWLDNVQISHVEKICRETDCHMSIVVRSALNEFFNRRPNESRRSDGAMSSAVQGQIAVRTSSQATGDRGELPGAPVVPTERSKAATSTSSESCPRVRLKAAPEQRTEAGPSSSLPLSI